MYQTPENIFTNHSAEKEKNEMYQTMYQSLFEEISKALTILECRETESMDSAIKTLKNAQCEAEEIFMNTKQCDENHGLYSDLSKRLNLQAIGYFIKEESTLNDVNCTSFTQRNSNAEKALNDTLDKLIDEETADKIYRAVLDYSTIKEEIQFSLGMKTGAKLALLLTSDSEYDF